MAIRMLYHLSEKGGSHLEFDNMAVAVANGLWYFSSSDIFMALKRKPTQGSFPNARKKNFTCAAYALIVTEIALGTFGTFPPALHDIFMQDFSETSRRLYVLMGKGPVFCMHKTQFLQAQNCLGPKKQPALCWGNLPSATAHGKISCYKTLLALFPP